MNFSPPLQVLSQNSIEKSGTPVAKISQRNHRLFKDEVICDVPEGICGEDDEGCHEEEEACGEKILHILGMFC